jgi:hypothetical protein
MSMSGAIKLTYGSFGTGSLAGAAVDDFASEADLDVAATSSGGGLTMTGTLELDEGGAAAGPVTISSGALVFTYDANDIGALAVAPDGTFAEQVMTAKATTMAITALHSLLVVLV